MSHIKTYVLAPPEIPFRLPLMRQRFAAAGITAEEFAGVHGPTLALKPMHAVFDSPTFYKTSGHVGIFLSMILLFHIIRERDDEAVLVLENDTLPCPNFWAEFERSYRSLPNDWDVVHVGNCCADDKPTERVNDRIARVRYPLCTHAMLYRKKAMLKLLELFRGPCTTKFDIYLAQVVLPRVNHYAFIPPLVDQPPLLDEFGVGSANAHTWQDIPGWFDWQRIADEQVDHRQFRSGVLVEVGSYLGRSTAYIADRIKWRLATGLSFFAVDTWKGTPNTPEMAAELARHNGDLFNWWQQNMSRCGVINYVTPMRMTSLEAATRFADGSVDWVHIDADHSYEAVRADILAWRPKVRGPSSGHHGGTLSGHDIDLPGVRKAVDELLGGRWRRWENCWIVDGGR